MFEADTEASVVLITLLVAVTELLLELHAESVADVLTVAVMVSEGCSVVDTLADALVVTLTLPELLTVGCIEMVGLIVVVTDAVAEFDANGVLLLLTVLLTVLEDVMLAIAL